LYLFSGGLCIEYGRTGIRTRFRIYGFPFVLLLADHEKNCLIAVLEDGAVIELSQYVFEALRKDEEFVLYRGRSKDDGSQVLVLSPLAEYPAPKILEWLEHAYSLREQLDQAWAAQPIAIARQWTT
jgi:hypothetical protein